ncbi:MAG TPA: hypothetical protein VF921_02080 [Vicinamibacterales bacterium]
MRPRASIRNPDPSLVGLQIDMTLRHLASRATPPPAILSRYFPAGISVTFT